MTTPDLLARIREKVRKRQTHEITGPEKEAEGKPRSAEIVDLMALLKRSLKAAPTTQATRSRPRKAGKADLRVVEAATKAAPKRKRA